jgi:hypothetical protein
MVQKQKFRRDIASYPAARTRADEASFGRFRGRCLGRQPKTGVVLRRLLEFAAITGTPRIENGGTFAVDFADGRRNRHNFYVRSDAPQQLAYTASHPAPLNRSATICTPTALSIARPQNDGLAEAGSNEAKSVSWHSGPERGFQPDRAGLRVLQGWRRSELLASRKTTSLEEPRAARSGVDKSSHGDFPSSLVNFCAALSISVATFARTSAQASTMSSLLSIVFRKSKIWASERSRSLSSNWNWRRCSTSSRLRASISSAGWRYTGFLRATIRFLNFTSLTNRLEH